MDLQQHTIHLEPEKVFKIIRLNEFFDVNYN